MALDDKTRNIEMLIAKHKKRLQALREQQAVYGISADPHIPIEISEIEGEISKLQTHLQELERKGPSIAPVHIDYDKLETLLSTGDWVEGDEESKRLLKLIYESTRVKYNGKIMVDAAPCEELRKLNKIWLRHSKGHFGPGVQLRIWRTIPYEHESDEWERVANFGIQLGWLDKSEINRKWGFLDVFYQNEKLRWMGTSDVWDRIWETTNIRELPKGYLPYMPTFSLELQGQLDEEPSMWPWARWLRYYFARINACKI
ncbi:GUN4 domain-containing protein [bacterium]|nr:GUN4 domain-containing protein [bacterium]